ncbi:MAG: acetolactate decarboxylase [Negativicutes bacterium]|nr:acetolactate decarboxylase [Negativicutes bacterium]
MYFTKQKPSWCLVTVFIMLLILAIGVPAFASVQEPQDTLFQVSTLTGLEHGVFYPTTTVGDLKQRGDTGVGAFEGMDGELVLIGGKVFNAMYDGKVVAVVDDKTPITYGAAAFMNPNEKSALQNIASYQALQQKLDTLLPNPNIFYVFKIHGTFSYLKVRSTAKQELPYPGLDSVIKNQSVFEFSNITGTLVGVRCPAYIKGVYAPGYHLHFISDDLQKGGHVLDLFVADAEAQIGNLTNLHLLLPNGPGAKAIDLSIKAN